MNAYLFTCVKIVYVFVYIQYIKCTNDIKYILTISM